MIAAVESSAYLVDGPGVYPEIPDDVYHADAACEEITLSASGAKKLLPPSCPAMFKWELDNPPAPKRQFDFGHAAHKLVLGVGLDVVVIDAENYRTKAAQKAQKEAHAQGKAPLLRAEWETVQAMAAALREHPVASAVLRPDAGAPEVSLYWRDTVTSVLRRARLDWLPHEPTALDRLIVTDYKTAADADPRGFASAAARYRYHLSAATYIEAVRALELAEDLAFLFIVQSKEPPHLVSVVELDHEALQIGRALNRRAVDTFAACMTTDTWPAWSEDVVRVSLPRWAAYEAAEETE